MTQQPTPRSPTHFSLAQAVACAADLVGPGSATGAAVAAGAARAPTVLFVGMNHDIDACAEGGRLHEWAAAARVARPEGGRDALAWGAPGDALGFSPALARDGLALPVAIAEGVASLEALRAEVDALRAAAAALAGAEDGEDYAERARLGLDRDAAKAAAKAAPMPAAEEAGRAGPRVRLRWRETYLSCLPPGLAVYAESASARVRGAWAFRVPRK